MVPQYIFCYRDRGATDLGVSFYVMALGGYRVFYAANWIYKKVQLGAHYHDIQSWMSGFVEISFFVDYLLARFTGFSVLRTIVLAVDEKVNDIKGKVVSKVRGTPHVYGQIETESGTELRQRRKVENADEETGDAI